MPFDAFPQLRRLPAKLLAACSILVVGSSARAQAPAFQGCYTLTIGDWSPRLSSDSIYYRVPTSIRLDTVRLGPGWRLSPDIPYPRENPFPTTPRWETRGDTLVLIWSNGFSPTLVRLMPEGSELAGEAVALTDYHPIPEPPRPRARVVARRQSCGG